MGLLFLRWICWPSVSFCFWAAVQFCNQSTIKWESVVFTAFNNIPFLSERKLFIRDTSCCCTVEYHGQWLVCHTQDVKVQKYWYINQATCFTGTIALAVWRGILVYLNLGLMFIFLECKWLILTKDPGTGKKSLSLVFGDKRKLHLEKVITQSGRLHYRKDLTVIIQFNFICTVPSHNKGDTRRQCQGKTSF